MVLFGISFLLVFISSYLITSIIAPKKSILGLIYLFLLAFAQIILTFELLSLINAISGIGVLMINILFLLISTIIWNKYGFPLWAMSFKDFIKRILNSFKLDKCLILLFIGYCIFIFSALFLCILMPTTNHDGQTYHVVRSLFWISQGNLNHFNIADIRCLCLPINSEILYTWVFVLAKKDVFLGFFAFVGYVLSIVSTYNILSYIGFCTRKKLWVIFILSSLAFVISQASNTETDIIIAGLITSSIFLFWYALKNNKKLPVYMASLAYAIAIGTKTTAIIVIPGVGLFLLFLSKYYKNFKPIFWFLGLGFLNFLIFSSYNYILNFLQFHNFISSESFIVVSKNYYGIKGMISNFVKNVFMLFDFSGYHFGDYLRVYILNFRDFILGSLNLRYIHDGVYTTGYDMQRTLYDQLMGSGLLGAIVVLPCWIFALVKPIFYAKSTKTKVLFAFAVLLLINIITMSYLLPFMSFSIRFIMLFIILSAPILTYSYFSNKNPVKYFILLIALFYFVVVSTHLWSRPVSKMVKLILFNKYSISDIRNQASCKNFNNTAQDLPEACLLKFSIQNNFTTQNKFLVFMNASDKIYFIKELELQGYKIDFAVLEDANKINYDNYNIIILPANNSQISTLIKDYDSRKNECIFKDGKFYLKSGVFVPCLYLQNDTLPKSTNGDKYYPYQVECVVTKNFIQQKYLKYLYKTGIFYNNAKNDKSYYMIYRNAKLPIYAKKT